MGNVQSCFEAGGGVLTHGDSRPPRVHASQLTPSAYASEGLQQLQQKRLGAGSPHHHHRAIGAAAAAAPLSSAAPLAAGAPGRAIAAAAAATAEQPLAAGKAAGALTNAMRNSGEGWSIPSAPQLPAGAAAGSSEASDELASLRSSGGMRSGSAAALRRSAEGAAAPAAAPPRPFSWTKGEQIGAGAFGRVFSGLNNETGEIIAIKQVIRGRACGGGVAARARGRGGRLVAMRARICTASRARARPLLFHLPCCRYLNPLR